MKKESRPDLILLLSLILVILLQPLAQHSEPGRGFVAVLVFLPIIIVTFRLSEKKGWLWPTVLLALAAIVLGVTDLLMRSPGLELMKWLALALFLGFSVFGLFSYIMSARSIIAAHLNTAVSVYLLIGLFWFAVYSAINTIAPGAIQCSNPVGERQTDLLYFSLATLTTLGYGDVVPVHGYVRILAAVEAITGVLYIAITIAALVSSMRQGNNTTV